MKLRENIAVSESGFLFDPNSGESFNVNAFGREIIRMISEGQDEEEIKTNILKNFDIEEGNLSRYLDDFEHSLRRFNLIEINDDI